MWCTIITSRVPSACCEMASERITSSEDHPAGVAHQMDLAGAELEGHVGIHPTVHAQHHRQSLEAATDRDRRVIHRRGLVALQHLVDSRHTALLGVASPETRRSETTVAPVMHPVGPLNPKVYWIRRVSIVVLAVAVLIGVVWFLAKPDLPLVRRAGSWPRPRSTPRRRRP